MMIELEGSGAILLILFKITGATIIARQNTIGLHTLFMFFIQSVMTPVKVS